MSCKDCELIFVKKVKSNGDYLINKQCKKCGFKDTKAYKFDLVGGATEVKKLPYFNEELYESYCNKQTEQRKQEYLKKRNERLDELSNYYKTDKWKAKRLKVLERDNYTCKACETNKATQVHHLSYHFFANEPLFDLVSVCVPCHEKIEYLKKKQNHLLDV